LETLDIIVIGAGVVGLAVARLLALGGRGVLVLEAEAAFGTQTSARNSEVIHAGLYYAAGSLKAALCVRGKKLLYRYFAERNIPHRRVGKLLIATDESELPALASYGQRAATNGVPPEPLTIADIRRLEPAVRAIAGLIRNRPASSKPTNPCPRCWLTPNRPAPRSLPTPRLWRE